MPDERLTNLVFCVHMIMGVETEIDVEIVEVVIMGENAFPSRPI